MKRTKDIDLVREYVEADRYEFYQHALIED